MMDGKSHPEPVIQMCDVFVDKNGLCFTTDHHAGFCVIEYTG
jgi:hypothetical protein